VRKLSKYANKIGDHIDVPNFHELLCRFLYDQRNPDSQLTGNDVPLSECPDFSGAIDVFHSASAYYYAPSDICGSQGMTCQVIHSTSCWKNGPARYDCILVDNDPTLPGIAGMYVGQVILFFSFKYRGYDYYPCALVKWFIMIDENPCPVTGMWRVQPEMCGDQRVMSVIHVDSIMRGVHLIPLYGVDNVDIDLQISLVDSEC
jgi:hypothetical protein